MLDNRSYISPAIFLNILSKLSREKDHKRNFINEKTTSDDGSFVIKLLREP